MTKFILKNENHSTMKTPYFILAIIIICFSCNKSAYVYSYKELKECLGKPTPTDSLYEVENRAQTFDEGIFVYQNCRGTKEIDGVKVNWLEDEDCFQWINADTSVRANENYISKLKRLTNSSDIKKIEVPQRFFLIFLDDRRVLYYTNHESAEFIKKKIKTIYKEPIPNEQLDSFIHTKILESQRNGFFSFRGKKKSKQMDYTFAPLNWNNWSNKYTYNQVIPIQKSGWKKHMKGVYQTYRSRITGIHYLKISFDTGNLKKRKVKKGKPGAKGLIELFFQTDENFRTMKLVKMNIPDSSVSLVSENNKGARRRDLNIKEVFAIQPIFTFRNEPVKLLVQDEGKEMFIKQIFFTERIKNVFFETWVIDGDETIENPIKIFWHTNSK